MAQVSSSSGAGPSTIIPASGTAPLPVAVTTSLDESSQGEASDRKEKKRKRISDVAPDEEADGKKKKKQEKAPVDEDKEARRERKRLKREKKAAKEAAKAGS